MSARSLALQELLDFQERIPEYSAQRNFDRPGHAEVSRLSRWIRYRVISEEECVAAVLERHPFEVAEKFVQEVLWRTYWKGWLEQRPQVWNSYADSLAPLREEFDSHVGYRATIDGCTGLPFFDDWVRELRETGYLHNHARMWFASVWIFTLQLPWQLGADLMYRHLLDGDPASNTLSWRWVGGLQTPGKIYVARPDNIERYSDGRWRPKASDLNPDPRPLPMDDIGAPVPLETVSNQPFSPGECILLNDDDLSAELTPELAGSDRSFLLWDRAQGGRSDLVRNHLTNLRSDTRERTGAMSVDSVEGVVRHLERSSPTVVHIMKPHCGEVQRELLALTTKLATEGIVVVFHRRRWDESYFPLAKSGFFPFWTAAKRRLERGR
jgi:deoxyribodipyrimidine photo-lyase